MGAVISPEGESRVAGSNQALVERLFAEHGRALRAFFHRRLRRRTEAADLAQEVYVRMLRIADVHAIVNPEAYLFAVAGNLMKAHARRERVHSGSVDVDDVFVAQQLAELPDIGGEIDRARREQRLREVLRQLPDKCQATVRLQYREDLSYAEIGERLGISVNMVKKYLSQALVHCRRRMGRLR
jgi:RNA polymerase sigma factor (sigma-70 family)